MSVPGVQGDMAPPLDMFCTFFSIYFLKKENDEFVAFSYFADIYIHIISMQEW